MAEAAVVNNSESAAENGGHGLTNGVTNGTTNGHSDKHKDRDKDRHKSSHKDKDRDRDRHSSSHKSSHKDRDKDRDKDRHKSSSESKDKDKHRSSSDKDRHKSSSKDKHKSSSSDKDRHKSSSDKDRDRHKDKERSDKDRHKSSSSSSSKDKDRHSSSSASKDRHSSSNGEKRDKDRHHHSSSSKSSHKDKHRDKDRDRHRDERKEKEKSSSHDAPQIKEEPASGADTSQDSMDGSMFSNTTQDTTSASMMYQNDTMSSQDESMDMKGEASADSEEDDNKLVINVKDEPMDQSANQEDDEDDVPLAARAQPKTEVSFDEDDLPLSNRKRPKYEPEEDDEDDVPLMARKKVKKEESDEEDDVPLAARRKTPQQAKKKKRKMPTSDDEDDDDFKPQKAKKAKVKKEKPEKKPSRASTGSSAGAEKGAKKPKKENEEEKNVWKWWEEEKKEDGRKWTFLEHRGIVFADPYERLPANVLMKYDGKPMPLSEGAEEVAGFYARMLEHDYVTKEAFNKNFFKDFRKSMNSKEREIITDLSKCDFSKMHTYFVGKNEERKNKTKEEKKALKEKNEALIKEYGWCIIDGHKQRIGNFKAEPPGLFRGRGDHPKMGMLKRRLMPEDVIINCSSDSNIPQPPAGHKWKEVRHDNAVTWLASWTENVQGQTKYVMMNAASKLKGEKDWMKYETARRLHQIADRIRDQYRADWKSKEMRIRQRAVALYFIDRLALRAGNEKDEDQADTVGCCSLRVEHITLYDEKDGQECVVAFDFLGKDSIRYYNEVPVEKRVFKNLRLFMENKQPADDLFDRLNTQILNKHLTDLMDGLTAKVFRTYNASRTLQEQLDKLTDPDDEIPSKVLSYNRANREVAILCNHQRAVPKTFDQSMANLQKKIDDKKDAIAEAERDLKVLKRQAKSGGSMSEKSMADKKKKQLDRLNEQLRKLEISATDKEENKQIALGTSKLNYLDPRISVAWCKKHDVPIEKVYNKTQRLKFQWALEMATADYDFMAPPTSKVRSSNNTTNDDEEEEYDQDE